MRIGERKYGGATCVLGFVEGVPAHMKHETRLISNLETVPELRGKGHATELLNRIMVEADKKKVLLILNPGSYDEEGPSTDKLVEWYASMGFQELQKEPLLMVRMFMIPQMVEAARKATNIILEGAR